MLQIESTGKTIEQAIENGLAELKVLREDVDIKILQNASLFKKAKVLLIVDSEVEEQMKNRRKKIEDLELKLQSQAQDAEKPSEDAQKSTQDQEAKNTTEISGQDIAKTQEDDLFDEQNEQEMHKINSVKCENVAQVVVNFLKDFCEKMQVQAEIQVEKQNRDDVCISLNGEQAKNLIGFRGEGLNALQTLCNAIACKAEKNCPRVNINVNNFKEERQQSLIKLARRMAYKVAKSKQEVKLEPMNAYERKIIHLALEKDSFVQTHSVGVEPKRCLVISLKKDDNN